MEVMGVDPFEALVLPRFLALLIMIPLLVFVATLAGLLGGMLVVWAALDLTPTFFLQRIVDNVGVTQFWIGLSKAPVMAMVIAAIGCRQGMDVGGDVESLGDGSVESGGSESPASAEVDPLGEAIGALPLVFCWPEPGSMRKMPPTTSTRHATAARMGHTRRAGRSPGSGSYSSPSGSGSSRRDFR